MTEIKLENGAVCTNGLGMPETVSGLDALLQRAYNRLNIARGSFRYDRTLGCRIRDEESLTPEMAMRFVQEALLDCPEIAVIGVEIHAGAVTVLLSTALGAGNVTVYLKEGQDDI